MYKNIGLLFENQKLVSNLSIRDEDIIIKISQVNTC